MASMESTYRYREQSLLIPLRRHPPRFIRHHRIPLPNVEETYHCRNERKGRLGGYAANRRGATNGRREGAVSVDDVRADVTSHGEHQDGAANGTLPTLRRLTIVGILYETRRGSINERRGKVSTTCEPYVTSHNSSDEGKGRDNERVPCVQTILPTSYPSRNCPASSATRCWSLTSHGQRTKGRKGHGLRITGDTTQYTTRWSAKR